MTGHQATSEQPSIHYQWMPASDVPRLAELDRSERVTLNYRMEEGALTGFAVDWDVPRWFAEGDGEHTVAHHVHFCQQHLAQGSQMLGAFDGDTLVGLGTLQPQIRPGLAQLAFLHVSRAYRRRGIAAHLVEQLCDEVRRAGATAIYVSATPSESAVGFYRSQGFALTDQPIPELLALEPEDIHMVKRFPADI
ncbi:MAG: GNAT family N-acetyltransferase [Chloroflexi bacterium]|nr:GNAT family N-acetyltransferase [Chloroflexota bacterium]